MEMTKEQARKFKGRLVKHLRILAYVLGFILIIVAYNSESAKLAAMLGYLSGSLVVMGVAPWRLSS